METPRTEDLLATSLLSARYVRTRRERLESGLYASGSGGEADAIAELAELDARMDAEQAARAAQDKMRELGFRRSRYSDDVWVRKENGRWREYSHVQAARVLDEASRG